MSNLRVIELNKSKIGTKIQMKDSFKFKMVLTFEMLSKLSPENNGMEREFLLAEIRYHNHL